MTLAWSTIRAVLFSMMLSIKHCPLSWDSLREKLLHELQQNVKVVIRVVARSTNGAISETNAEMATIVYDNKTLACILFIHHCPTNLGGITTRLTEARIDALLICGVFYITQVDEVQRGGLLGM